MGVRVLVTLSIMAQGAEGVGVLDTWCPSWHKVQRVRGCWIHGVHHAGTRCRGCGGVGYMVSIMAQGAEGAGVLDTWCPSWHKVHRVRGCWSHGVHHGTRCRGCGGVGYMVSIMAQGAEGVGVLDTGCPSWHKVQRVWRCWIQGVHRCTRCRGCGGVGYRVSIVAQGAEGVFASLAAAAPQPSGQGRGACLHACGRACKQAPVGEPERLATQEEVSGQCI